VYRVFLCIPIGMALLCSAAAGQDKAASEAKVDSAQVYLDKGRELAQANQMPEALASFERAIALNPNFEEAWRGKGAVLLRMDRQDESLAATAKAIELKPDDYKAWLNKGRALMRKGQNEEALKTFESLRAATRKRRRTDGPVRHVAGAEPFR
jgi:tetratricopeptide (TPR) repeat protein